MKKFHAIVAAMALGVAAPSYAAIATFATFTPTELGTNLSYTPGNGQSASTITNTANNEFFFRFLGGGDQLLSRFTLSAASASSPQGGGTVEQTGFSGNFDFIYSGASDFTLGGNTYSTGTSLLSAVFTNATFIGGGSAGGLFASDSGPLSPSSTIFFSSDVLPLSPSTARDFSFALSGVVPGVNSGSGFTGTVTGGASTDAVLPDLNSATPEAGTWAMLIIGFGAIGSTVRARKRAQAPVRVGVNALAA